MGGGQVNWSFEASSALACVSMSLASFAWVGKKGLNAPAVDSRLPAAADGL